MTISRSILLLASASAVALLSGCGAWEKKEAPSIDPAEAALSAAAADIAAAWSRTSSSMASRAEAEAEDATTTSGDASFGGTEGQFDPGSPLAMRVDMNWFGELQPAVEALAATAGFTTQMIGAKKGPPILVTIEGVDVPLMDLLRQAGIQAGRRADVVVRESAGTIEVIYRD